MVRIEHMMDGGSNKNHGYVVTLHEDLFPGILVRLPAKSLLRFRTVCKSWGAIIKGSDFINHHAAFEDTSKLGTFIYQAYRGFDSTGHPKNAFYVISGDEDLDTLECLGGPDYFQKWKLRCIHMTGSFHGIVCLHDYVHWDIALWNPVNKQFRLLPKSPSCSELDSVDDHFAAFGFDVRSKDYKVLEVNSFHPVVLFDPFGLPRGVRYAGSILQIQVYSLRCDSWKRVDVELQTHCSRICSNTEGRHFNGKYFCLGENYFENGDGPETYEYKILSYDFSEENFKIIQVPDDCKQVASQIDFIGEKLACIKIEDYKMYEIWVLNEYCANRSWTKLYTVAPFIYVFKRPIGFLRNGEVAVLNRRGGLQLINLVTQETKLQVPDLTFLSVDIFKSSLISVSRNGSATNNAICSMTTESSVS